MAQVTKKGVNQPDLVDFLRALRNRMFNSPGLATGTTTSKLKTVNATSSLNYMIDGKLYVVAAADDAITFSGLTNTGAGEKCIVRIEIDAANAFSFVQGPIDARGDKMPRRTAGKCTVGWIEVPASFTFGTTSCASLTSVNNGDPDLLPSVFYANSDTGGLES